jgi:N-acetyl-gamma-glutamyl-phosphate reductase
MNKVRVGIVGAAGLSAGKLLGILARHPGVELGPLVSESAPGSPITNFHPELLGRVDQRFSAWDTDALAQCDFVFSCKRHGESWTYIPQLLEKGCRVIDLSGDFRLKDASLYDAWYGMPHTSPAHLQTAVYGLPEVRRDAIRHAQLIANPGCYTTASILAARPFFFSGLALESQLLVHAMSGVSGAGRAAKEENLFISVADNIRAYKIGNHQHTPEIEQELTHTNPQGAAVRPTLLFVPHVGPYKNGIMATAYLKLLPDTALPPAEQLLQILHRAYEGHPFIRIRGTKSMPQLAPVVGTNFCDLGVTVDARTRTIIVVSCIDNLIKGAAGQAVQNLNLMAGFAETTALI